MTEIVITADIHLKEQEDGRSDVLQWICDEVERESADILLIAGDLFDSASAARARQSEVQEIFDSTLPKNTSVVMVAGNHDEILPELGWSGDVTVLDRWCKVSFEIEDQPITLHGLPYLRGRSFQRLNDEFEMESEGINMLVGHATYLTDRSGYRDLVDNILDSNEENEFLVHEKDLSGTGFDQILFGHWHGYRLFESDPPTRYIGSPVPNSTRETGTKNILLGSIHGDGLQLRKREIDTPPGWFYESVSLTVLPGYEDEFMSSLSDELSVYEEGSVVLLDVSGYTEWDVERFRRELRSQIQQMALEEDRVQLDLEVQSAESFDFPLIDRLVESLNELDVDEVISLQELFSDQDPDRVFSVAGNLLEESPSGIEHRAKQLMMGALVEVLDQ